jgi:hypothetical protein
MLQQGNHKPIKDAYASAAGEHSQDPVKKWLIDLDAEHLPFEEEIVGDITNREHKSATILGRIPTVNGLHLITTTFNRQKPLPYGVDIHKDNPTVLYYGG